MPDTRSSVFNDFSRLVNDATEMAQGVRREAEHVVKAQAGAASVGDGCRQPRGIRGGARHGDCRARRKRPAAEANRSARSQTWRKGVLRRPCRMSGLWLSSPMGANRKLPWRLPVAHAACCAICVFSTLTELPLASGRRADVVALAADGTIVIVEIKSSLADFRADQKWPDYRAHCDRLYFAISDNLAPEIMPAEAGLIVADSFWRGDFA